jgi:nucleotide-binding universal stress UspA family protein
MRILLAIDDSKFSEAATQAVQTHARLPGTEVRVIHVIDPLSVVTGSELGLWSGPELETLWHGQRTWAEALLAKAAQALRTTGCDVTTSVEEGDPKSRIIDLAAAWHADLIVVGSHGRKGLDRFLLGSVSEAVARHAPCSVELVRIRSGTDPTGAGSISP